MKKLVECFKALGEETRIKIIHMLCKEEMCVCELIDKLNLSQSAVSHHLKILKQAGLLQDRRRGKWIFYSLNKEAFDELLLTMQDKIWNPVLNSCYFEKVEPKDYCEKYDN